MFSWGYASFLKIGIRLPIRSKVFGYLPIHPCFVKGKSANSGGLGHRVAVCKVVDDAARVPMKIRNASADVSVSVGRA
jgi:hypothetical protein